MSEEKPKFWKTPIGAILSNGMHDHVNANAISKIIVKDIRDLTIDREVLKWLDTLDECLKVQKESIDYIYNNIKKEMGY